jgi:hypothetical protein
LLATLNKVRNRRCTGVDRRCSARLSGRPMARPIALVSSETLTLVTNAPR